MFFLPITRESRKDRLNINKEDTLFKTRFLNEKQNFEKELLSIRKRQIEAVYTILHLCLLRKDYIRAKYAFSILIHCREIRLYDIWDIGLEILRHFNSDQQEIYLKHLMVLYQAPVHSILRNQSLSTQEFLRALVLLYIEKGEFQKLLDMLEDYLLSAPYSENSVFFEYAAMTALELSQKTNNILESERFRKKAQYLFQKAKEKGGTIFYTDTFDIFTNEEC
ncbi:hypothetical protein PCANB_001650 [Pneumocystis canis]|nr:hypothetical protein PCK1_001668 [Pneumocystis canis]KAG5436897.1 hypothetical protein PCANB_001650 [Pneumocystis canis]